MNGTLALITAPATTPISVDDVKSHSRISTSDDDTKIGQFINAAVDYAQETTRRQFVNATYDLFLPSFPAKIVVPKSPLVSVTSITYDDVDGASQTLASSVYRVDIRSTPGEIETAYGQTWPATRAQSNAVAVRVVLGYGANATDTPARIRQALLMLVGHWYENRETVSFGGTPTDIPHAVNALLWSFKVPEIV